MHWSVASEPVFASHPRIQSPMVVHESPQYIVVDESPPPPPQPNTGGSVSPPLSPLAAHIQRVDGIPYLVPPFRDGGGAGDIPLVGGRLRLLLCAPHPRFTLRGGPLVPPWPGGAAGGGGGGSYPPRGGGGPSFQYSGGPIHTGGRMNQSTPVAVPGVWCTIKRASNLWCGTCELNI